MISKMSRKPNLDAKASDSVFVKLFVFTIIRNMQVRLRKGGFLEEGSKSVINSELVPKFSDEVSRGALKESIIHSNKSFKILPLRNPRGMPVAPMHIPPRAPQAPVRLQLVQPPFLNSYGRIDALLKDPSVSTIECPAPNEQIYVMRHGQKQLTKISLGQEEIKRILVQVAEEARIPLLEGIFRAAADNFMIDAVVSEEVGSRFVITKQSPFSPVVG